MPRVIKDTPYSHEFTAATALNPACGWVPKWVSPDNEANAGFTLDYTQTVKANGFYLRNGNNFNTFFFDSGTNDFTIEVSMDKNTWVLEVEGRMPGEVPDNNCENTRFWKSNNDTLVFRYVKFTAKTFHQKRSALSFFAPRELDCELTNVLMDFSFPGPQTSAYRAQNVLYQACSTENNFGSHWVGFQTYMNVHGEETYKGIGFLLDLGRTKTFVGFQVTNDENAPFYSGGTEDFDILVSEDLATWRTAVKGRLQQNPKGVCSDPTIFFNQDHQVIKARYVRFRDISNYLEMPALAFFAPVLSNAEPNATNSKTSWCSQTPLPLDDEAVSPDLSAKEALKPECGEHHHMWAGPENRQNGSFSLDYGHVIRSDGFYLRNQNKAPFDVSTKDFQVLVSTNYVDWDLVVEDTFEITDTPYAFCEETKFYPTGQQAIEFRYVKFVALSHSLRYAGLSFIAAREIGCSATKILMDFSLHPDYGALNVLSEECSATNGFSLDEVTWIGNEEAKGSGGFIMDFGQSKEHLGFLLINDNNHPWNDRGTEGFHILVSDDLDTWRIAVNGSLPRNKEGECGRKLGFLNVDHVPMKSRYVHFETAPTTGLSPALAFLKPMTSDDMDCRLKDEAFAEIRAEDVLLQKELDLGDFIQCSAMCADFGDDCAAALFQPLTLCLLLKKSALGTNLIESKGAHLFLRHCRPSCTMPGFDVDPNAMGSLKSNQSMEECRRRCQTTSGCAVASFQMHADSDAGALRGDCFLKMEDVGPTLNASADTSLLFKHCGWMRNFLSEHY